MRERISTDVISGEREGERMGKCERKRKKREN
jgi:hypothetical protein